MTPEILVDLDVKCECGAEINFKQDWSGEIICEPCEKCIKEAIEEAKE